VLVEGPRSFTPLIPLLVHAEARMPLAVYTYAVQKAHKDQADGDVTHDRRAAYYPFCDHSPELVALRVAASRGIPARFIDLNFAEQCRLESAGRADDDRDDGDERSLLDERYYRRSRYLHVLAQRLGCREHEELWEHLCEVPAAARSLQAHVNSLSAYCYLARIECTEDELVADGTLAREAEMAWHIKQALAERAQDGGPVVVVMGGFHAVAMPTLISEEVQRPSIPRGTITDESSSIIRYSFDRLDRLNGYAAGMASPAWQQRLWEQSHKYDRAGVRALALERRVRQEVTLSFLFEIACELREKLGVPLPMPALGAAYEHALQLAALRRRPAPVRDDVLDAVTSCFVKGDADADGALVLAVARRVLSGQAMGKVPPGASTPPLVRDFEYRARRQRLRIDDSRPRRTTLDLYRKPEHRVTSRLLHGLALLGVPFGVRTAGPDFVNGVGLDRLHEHWEYTHTAATEAALVEASMYGVTVPLAVAARFAVRLERFDSDVEKRDARAAAALLMHACVLGLHDHLPRMFAVLRRTIGADAGFESVAMAASSLGLLWESREPLEARDIGELPALLQAIYERSIYLGRSLRGLADDGRETLEALSRLRELLSSGAGRPLDATLYWSMVATLNKEHDAALIRGAAAGLLYSGGRMSESELGAALDGHFSGQCPAREAVSFLRGLLHTAREAAWQLPSLLNVLDALLQRWDEAAFVSALPELRLAFAGMTPKETDRVAQAVASLYGVGDLGPLMHYDHSAAEVQARLVLSQELMDVLADDGLQAWVAP
jgi:hypothetical protein